MTETHSGPSTVYSSGLRERHLRGTVAFFESVKDRAIEGGGDSSGNFSGVIDASIPATGQGHGHGDDYSWVMVNEAGIENLLAEHFAQGSSHFPVVSELDGQNPAAKWGLIGAEADETIGYLGFIAAGRTAGCGDLSPAN